MKPSPTQKSSPFTPVRGPPYTPQRWPPYSKGRSPSYIPTTDTSPPYTPAKVKSPVYTQATARSPPYTPASPRSPPIPPTTSITSTATLTDCTNIIGYIDDITIPDDTVFTPDNPIVKTWRLRNDGTCPWTEEYTMVYVGGDDLIGPITPIVLRRIKLHWTINRLVSSSLSFHGIDSTNIRIQTACKSRS